MNDDLLPQFVAEARELLQDAGTDLLALERDPTDAAGINRLLRSVHTLKGSSGLFVIPAFTRVLHAAEDLMQAVREHRMALRPEMVDAVLQALDQTGRWVDYLDQHGEMPADGGAIAAEMAVRLRAHLGAVDTAPGSATPAAAVEPDAAAASPPPPTELLRRFDARQRAKAAHGAGLVHIISYRPPAGSFFKGEDPLHLALHIPALQAFALEAPAAWEPLAALDPFHCNLGFHAISSADPVVLQACLRYVVSDVTIVTCDAAQLMACEPAIAAETKPALASGLPEAQRRLLTQQIEMLELPADPEEAAGRLAAAARLSRNVLRSCGLGSALPLAACADAGRLHAALAALLVEDAAPQVAAPHPVEAAAVVKEANGATKRVLRVDQDKIDLLMKLVGELVVAKNSLPYLARRAEQHFGQRELGREIRDEYGVIDRIAQELQGAVMGVRMMPVGQVFQRFPRLVRDLARQLDKQVELVISGEDTEADKNVIESLFDPLLHMVRNSLDHGLEKPADRRAAGKPETARLSLRAQQDGDQVVIEIADDGRGINPALIKQKAFERGLLDAQQMAEIDEEAATMLVFAPGFSTAETISDVSGRGVGMDVVRAAVEKAGGRIALSSVTGAGTTVRLNLPLSMAVTRVMTVRLDGYWFGIPMDLVLETVKLAHESISRIKQAQVFFLRDRVVPLCDLAAMLQLPPSRPGKEVSVLVVQVGAQVAGLAVSAVGEVMEVILKPMEGVLAGLAGYCGTTLLGDGRVLLVLDLKALIL